MPKKKGVPGVPESIEKTIRMALLEKWSNDHWICGDKQPDIDAALKWLDEHAIKKEK